MDWIYRRSGAELKLALASLYIVRFGLPEKPDKGPLTVKGEESDSLLRCTKHYLFHEWVVWTTSLASHFCCERHSHIERSIRFSPEIFSTVPSSRTPCSRLCSARHCCSRGDSRYSSLYSILRIVFTANFILVSHLKLPEES